MDKDEVDQLKKEIGTIREGQQQALEEQWMKIEVAASTALTRPSKVYL